MFNGHPAMRSVPRITKFHFNFGGEPIQQYTRADRRAAKREEKFLAYRAAERAAGHISNRSKKG